MSIDTILQIVMIGSAVLMMVCILLQQRGATLFFNDAATTEIYTSRRGVDKSLFEVTIVLAVIFIFSILAGLLIPS